MAIEPMACSGVCGPNRARKTAAETRRCRAAGVAWGARLITARNTHGNAKPRTHRSGQGCRQPAAGPQQGAEGEVGGAQERQAALTDAPEQTAAGQARCDGTGAEPGGEHAEETRPLTEGVNQAVLGGDTDARDPDHYGAITSGRSSAVPRM